MLIDLILSICVIALAVAQVLQAVEAARLNRRQECLDAMLDCLNEAQDILAKQVWEDPDG